MRQPYSILLSLLSIPDGKLWGKNQPQAEAAVPIVGVADIPIGGTAEPGVVVPAATSSTNAIKSRLVTFLKTLFIVNLSPYYIPSGTVGFCTIIY